MRRRLLMPLLFVVAVSSCNEIPPDSITIVNQTDEKIDVWTVTAQGKVNRLLTEDLDPGREDVFPEEQCLLFEARRQDGTVIARSSNICQGDPPWVVTEPGG